MPAAFWFAEPLAPDPADPEAPAQLLLRGAVLVRVFGRAEGAPETPEALAEKGLPPELVAALQEPPLRPEKEIWRVLRQDGIFTFGVLAVALLIAALGVTIEAFLLQGVMRLGSNLLPGTRWFAIAALALFVLALFALELPLTAIQQRIGRRLETRLRILLLEKIPRLSDRYFHSRLTSDMTMRAHGLRSLRGLPSLAVNALRLGFQLLLTAAGVIILDPVSAPWAIAFALVFIAVAYFSNVIQREREMRLFTHNGALSRFYLDALLGLIPVRMHGAERAMRREHETLLTEWARSSLDTWRIVVILQGISATLYAAFSVVILLNFVARGGQMGNVLLLFYWTLNLPALAQSMFALLQQYPLMRNHTLRLLEPLGASDETDSAANVTPVLRQTHARRAGASVLSGLTSPPSPRRDSSEASPDSGPLDSSLVSRRNAIWPEDPLRVTVEAAPSPEGTAIAYQNVQVQAGGHTILSDINLEIRPGEHIAICRRVGRGQVHPGRHPAGLAQTDGGPGPGGRRAVGRRTPARSAPGNGVGRPGGAVVEPLTAGQPAVRQSGR